MQKLMACVAMLLACRIVAPSVGWGQGEQVAVVLCGWIEVYAAAGEPSCDPAVELKFQQWGLDYLGREARPQNRSCQWLTRGSLRGDEARVQIETRSSNFRVCYPQQPFDLSREDAREQTIRWYGPVRVCRSDDAEGCQRAGCDWRPSREAVYRWLQAGPTEGRCPVPRLREWR